jgi:tRNA pseudouridine55 synthase
VEAVLVADGPQERRRATDGLVVVDKPAGWTSHDVVGRIRRLAHTRRVGHAGTLDPMATGVLVVGVGTATRLLTHLAGTDKAYDATIRLGQATVSDDAEGEVTATASAADVTAAAVRAALLPLTGAIEQVPSSVSAIKKNGKRAYQRVRDGETVELAARPVTVSLFEARGFARPSADLLDVDVRVECSSGTYVRALARDLGAALGVGGHLTALRRTRVGSFTLDSARTLEDLGELADPVSLPLPDAVRAAMAVREVDEAQARELSFGRALDAVGVDGVHGAIGPDGTVLALLQERDGRARPVVVFAAAG